MQKGQVFTPIMGQHLQMHFSGKVLPKYKQQLKLHGTKVSIQIPKELGGKHTLNNGPMPVTVKQTLCRISSVKSQPTPIKDYMNFKQMQSGSEILLNLQNY